MKIIISRKGFDGSAGGVASPIFTENGRMTHVSFPIPLCGRGIKYNDLRWNGNPLIDLITPLRGNRPRLNGYELAHLDPDLSRGSLEGRDKNSGWRPVFGQSGPQETDLFNRDVASPLSCTPPGERPLFLLFGWFRDVSLNNGNWGYTRKQRGGSPRRNVHAFWGWLQVEPKGFAQHASGPGSLWARLPLGCGSSARRERVLRYSRP
ncbi:MAG: hypothetical protein ACRD1F_04505 [Terriglobales bacterium]